MKRLTISAAMLGIAALAAGAGASTPAWSRAATAQPSCASAPAVARAYLAAQAGKKLTMSRAAIIAQVTTNTGTDGEFAGLKPCDAGYPNAVRFYLDEVWKVGTNNSTP
jgi:hypothetical protein